MPQPYEQQRVGRPPSKAKDPVRKGLSAAFRSLREAQSSWNHFVPYDSEANEYVAEDHEGMKYVRQTVVYLRSTLEKVIADMDKKITARVSAPWKAAGKKKAAPKKVVKKVVKKQAAPRNGHARGHAEESAAALQ